MLSTLTTPTAEKAVERIVNAFPGSEQDAVTERLARMLRVVVSQRLVLRRGGESAAIFEVLGNEPHEAGILAELKANRSAGTRNKIDAELERLVRSGSVEPVVALAHASDRIALSAKLAAPAKARLR